jgi:putative polyhydroxyalkanoate system protein
MSKIHVRQAHKVGRTAARERLAPFESLLAKYNVKLAWKGDQASIQGLGVSGDVALGDDAVDVSVQLGLLAKAAGVDATKLRATIEKRLKEAFET